MQERSTIDDQPGTNEDESMYNIDLRPPLSERPLHKRSGPVVAAGQASCVDQLGLVQHTSPHKVIMQPIIVVCAGLAVSSMYDLELHASMLSLPSASTPINLGQETFLASEPVAAPAWTERTRSCSGPHRESDRSEMQEMNGISRSCGRGGSLAVT